MKCYNFPCGVPHAEPGMVGCGMFDKICEVLECLLSR